MATEARKAAASEEELKSLKEHFNDVGFQDYPRLIEDCKKSIIRCLEGRDLIRIGMCGKTEQRLAANFAVEIFGIVIQRGTDRNCEYEKVRAQFEKSGPVYDLHFKKNKEDVVVETPTGRLLWTYDNSAYYKEAVSFFEYLLKRCHYRVEMIALGMSEKALKWAARDDSPIGRFPDLRCAELGGMDSTQQKYWIGKMPNDMESLQFHEDVRFEVSESSQFRTARRIGCHSRCVITDDQFLELKASAFDIHDAPLLTVQGLNTLLKRWQCEGVKLVALDLGRVGNRGRRVRLQDIVAGLDASMTRDGDEESSSTITNKTNPAKLFNIGWIDGTCLRGRAYTCFVNGVPTNFLKP